MKICIACLTYSERLPFEPKEYLASVPLFRELPRRLAARGHKVVVVHQFPRHTRLEEEGLSYLFVPSGPYSQWLGKLLCGMS